MGETITIVDLFAIFIRRGKAILIGALVAALLLGGYQAYAKISAANSPENSDEKIEERYEKARADYERQKTSLEAKLTEIQIRQDNKKQYMDESMLMQIDPYNVYVSYIHIAASDIDEGAFQQVFYEQQTPVDYLISKIQGQYLLIWNSLDLPVALGIPGYEDVEDKYLREVIEVKNSEGGSITIAAHASSAAEAEKLANAAYACLMRYQNIVCEAAYAHQFSFINKSTKCIVDQSLEIQQRETRVDIEAREQEMDELRKQLGELQEPKKEESYSLNNIVKEVVKRAVLGAMIGAFLMCAYVWLASMFTHRMEMASQLEKELGIPLLGNMKQDQNVFERMANRMTGERIWTSSPLALSYISKAAKVHIGDRKEVLLVSTMDATKDQDRVKEIMDALRENGYKVSFEDCVLSNDKAVEAMECCEVIILVEKIGKTHMAAVSDAIALTKRAGKSIAGAVAI